MWFERSLKMLREILFRGKCKNDNKWLYGFPYVTRKYAVKINWYCSEFGSMRTDEIIPETVGQFTGVTDKNGKKIFEGDIMAFTAYGFDYVGTVEFADGSFSIMCEHTSPFLDQAVSKHGAYIIGNMHDNPELLNGFNEEE